MFVCAECGASSAVPGHCTADGSALAPIGDDTLLGQTIGPYRIARLLGIGGMGRVYKGVQPQIGSRVAIKVLSRECSDRRDLVDRFFAEAKAVNLIRHESIVNVLDLSTLPDGRPYIVMEYLDGSPLASILEHALHGGYRLPIGGVARLAAEVLDALHAAHAKGIVHRDLKPDNIFVTPGGRAKVLDFGIAKLQPELGGSATHTGSLLGTPHYMSPEQAAGRAVDHRADLYAMGVILFECMTLQRPFAGDSLFDLLRKHIEAPPPSPRMLRPDLPVALEQIIYTALAKQPEQRFASAQAMSMALQQATMQLPQEQWAPIVPANSRTSSAGWQPTPPASWAGSQRASHAVSSAERRRSRKGLWIALASLLFVGGGIAAVVLASGDDSKPETTASTAPSPAPSPAPPPPGPGPGPVPAPGPQPQETPPAPASDEDDDGDDDDDVVTSVDQIIAALPAQGRKMLPPVVQKAIKKYGSWAKVPKAEREAMAPAVMASLGQLMGGLDTALAPDPPAPAADKKPAPDKGPAPDTHPASDEPPAMDKGIGADGWVVSRNFPPPAGYSAKHVDVAKALPWALAEAKRLVPDAVLFRIDAQGVSADGHADLSRDSDLSLDFRFISPSHSKDSSSKEKKCMFRIELTKDGAWSAPLGGFACKEKLLGPPKCSVIQIWKKARAMNAPGAGVGELGYRATPSGDAMWYVDIEGGGDKFSKMFRDDC
jgi:serine/threonine-protein kinase